MRDMTPMDMVREFMLAMSQPVDVQWTDFATDDALLAYRLNAEEDKELQEAIEPVEIIGELADKVYVAYWFAAKFGWDLDTALRRKHAANMSKLGPDGKPIFDAGGKVLKGPNYKKPYLKDLV